MLNIGQKIPDFSLEIYQSERIQKALPSTYSGKWLIVFFYPGDFTFVCPTELEELADNYDKFLSLGAEILSISTNNVMDHKIWHETSPAIKKIKYPMGSDPNGHICQLFGVYDEQKGCAIRATFIFDPHGILKAVESNEDKIGRSVAELLRKLSASKYVNQKPDEMCPASWKPGKPTLKPKIK